MNQATLDSFGFERPAGPDAVNAPERPEIGVCWAADRDTTHTVHSTEERTAPEFEATSHERRPVTPDYSKAVVYTFPNHDGCRCSAQIQQYDQLYRELDGVNVYGIAPSTPDELADAADRFGIRHTLIADPHGTLAKRFGLSFEDGEVERATMFIEDGEIVDTVAGMHGVTLGSDDYQLAQEPEVVKRIDHPSVVTVLGARGAGKSSTAYYIGEQLHRHKGLTPVTVAVPEHVRTLFPPEWVHVDSIEAAPPDSVIVVDEAYRLLHAREWQQNDSVKVSKLINLSRQCERTIVFVSQSSKQMDGNVPLESDAVMMKEPGALHARLERREMRPIVEEAEDAFETVPKGDDPRGYAMFVNDDGKAMVRTDEADFFTEAVSKAFGERCETFDAEGGEKEVSAPVTRCL